MSGARFVGGLRTRPDVIALVPPDTPGAWTLRVQLLEAWDAVQLHALPSTPLGEVLRPALAQLAGAEAALAAYDCKLRGVLLPDPARSLEQVGACDGSILLLARAARQPAR
jgi:hypothetical protein